MDTLPWVEKYRPAKLDDIIGQDNIIELLKNMMDKGSLPNLLFYGAPGTGKTSTIMSIAKYLYGEDTNFMVLELNASDDRGINSVREEIKGFAEKLNLFKEGLKLIILDEVDAMTFDAQFALRFIMERYSATTRFCLICNYQNKIIPALRSRCACFRFAPIENTAITNILKNISKKEKIKFSDDIITSLCDISQGDIRKAINLLQTMSMHKKPSVELCYSLAATPNDKSMKKIIRYLTNEYVFEKKFEKIKELIANNGYSLHLVLECLNKYIQEFDITDKKLAKIISDLAVLEFRLNQSTFSDIYIINLVGIFMS